MLRFTVLAALLAVTTSFAPHTFLRSSAPSVALSPSLGSRLPVFALRCGAPRAAAAAGGDELVPEPPSEEATSEVPKQSSELKKILPLGLMFFFILFNYTILRDTKDVLVVTAPKCAAL